jgi:hypothetical protein
MNITYSLAPEYTCPDINSHYQIHTTYRKIKILDCNIKHRHNLSCMEIYKWNIIGNRCRGDNLFCGMIQITFSNLSSKNMTRVVVKNPMENISPRFISNLIFLYKKYGNKKYYEEYLCVEHQIYIRDVRKKNIKD